MEWQSEVEKEFKLKYANAYTELTPGYILQSIESRLNDVELAFKHKAISEDVYNKSKSELLERKKWVEEVDAEIKEALKETPEEDITVEEVATKYAAKKVKSKLKDIRKD